jgi:hypothetical protein
LERQYVRNASSSLGLSMTSRSLRPLLLSTKLGPTVPVNIGPTLE